MTPLQTLATFAIDLMPADVPSEMQTAVDILVLDAIGTAIGNRAAPFAVAMRDVNGADGAIGPCSVIGGGSRRLPAEAAAEVNSAAIHGSDLDATHIRSIIHPTAIAVPAGLALGEALDADGAETMTAIAAGMEILIRLGLAAGGNYHLRGYQPTALLGSVVAALMSARVHGRSAAAATHAAGLATAIAAGLRSFSDDGTWGKRLITGWACRSGLHADALAAAGFTGSPDALEKRWGLFPAFLPDGGFDLSRAITGLGRVWTTVETEPKRYPCSHGLHPFIESARSIRDRAPVADIVSVTCRVNAEAARWWFEPTAVRYRPDAYGARFSIPYAVARALIDGEVGDDAFEPDAVTDERVLELVDRVRPEIDPKLSGRPPVGLPGALSVTLRDGSMVEIAAAPDPQDTAAFVVDRFRATVGVAYGEAPMMAIEAGILGLRDAPSVRPMMRLAAG